MEAKEGKQRSAPSLDWVVLNVGQLQKLQRGEEVNTCNVAGIPVNLNGGAFSKDELEVLLDKEGVLVETFQNGAPFAITVMADHRPQISGETVFQA